MEIVKRNRRLIRHVDGATKFVEKAKKKNRKLMKRASPSEKRALLESSRMLAYNEQSLRLQHLAVMNVDMCLVYLLDFALQLQEGSSTALEEIGKVQKMERKVIVKTPQKYFKAMDAIIRQVESAQKLAHRELR
jgi:hypothetical protein